MKSVDVSWIPMYLDGSGAGMWQVPHYLSWSEVLAGKNNGTGRYIKVSDLMKLMEQEDIKLIYGQPEPEKT